MNAVARAGAFVPQRRSRIAWLRRAFSARAARVGGAMVLVVVSVALLGPLVAPRDPAALVGAPFSAPGEGAVLGTDYLGRDALSRFLWGGRTLLGVALLATALSYVVGVTVGLLAAARPGAVDSAVTAIVDVLLAFPPLLFVLLVLATGTSSVWLVAPAVAMIFAPRVARIVRGAALQIAQSEYVEAAVARGEGTRWVLFREILPNLWPPLLADIGIRFTASIIVIASVGFLGFGQQPPAADWGMMIGENRSGIVAQPVVIIAPVVAIALLTIGVNLVGDAMLRVLGRSDAVERSRAGAR